MRILSLANKVPFPRKDGGTIGILNILEGYADNGHEVTLLAMNTPKHRIRENEIAVEVKNKIQFILVDIDTSISWLKILVNWLFSARAYILERFISSVFKQKLISLLQEKSFDYIQLEGLYLCPYIPVVRKYSNAQIVFRAHNVEHEIWERTAQVAKGVKRLYLQSMANRLRQAETDYLNHYDILSTVTERDKEKLNFLGNRQPAFVMQPGFFIEKKPDFPSDNAPSVGFIGALDWIPNQLGLKWFVDHCWPHIHAARPEVHFWVAGRNAPKGFGTFLNHQAIHFLGEIDDARKFILDRRVLVVPLLSGSGVRVKILEGFSLGKAMVTTSIGAEGIPVVPGTELLIADTPESFTKAVVELLDSPQQVEQIGEAAFQLASEKYQYNKTVVPFLQFLEKEKEVHNA